MAEQFNAGDGLQKLKDATFKDLEAGRIQMGLPPEADIDPQSLFMNEVRTLTASQLRQMAAVPDKQSLALGSKVVLHETPGKCIDSVIFGGSGPVKIGEQQSSGITLGVALDERNELSPKCE